MINKIYTYVKQFLKYMAENVSRKDHNFYGFLYHNCLLLFHVYQILIISLGANIIVIRLFINI